MAHIRKRIIEAHIKDAMSFSPLVGVLGQRQTGKTTLVEGISGSRYVTFDDEGTRSAAELAPSAFLDQFLDGQAIDECQKVPAIFPALKLRVQKSQRPGQFLMTGSVRFTSRRAIQESLTGRLYSVEVLPLTVAELNKKALGDFKKWAELPSRELSKIVTERLSWFSEDKFKSYLVTGGLPGICFMRKDSHRAAKFKAQIQTLLERDLRLIIETTVDTNRLVLLLRHLARHQGLPLNLTEAGRVCGISEITLKKLLAAYEGLFLIRRFHGSGDRKSDLFYFEDQGMASFLTNDQSISDDHRFAFSQLFASSHYHHMNTFELSYFETKGGAHVPLVFKFGKQVVGFIFNPGEALTSSTVKSTNALISRFPNAHVFALSQGKGVVSATPNLTRIPLLAVV